MKYAVIYDVRKIYDGRKIYDVKAICVFSNVAERERGLFNALNRFMEGDTLADIMSTNIKEVSAKEAHKLMRQGIQVMDCKELNLLKHDKPIYCLHNRNNKLIRITNLFQVIAVQTWSYSRPNLHLTVIINHKEYPLLTIKGHLVTVFDEGSTQLNLNKIDVCSKFFPQYSITIHSYGKGYITYEAL